MLAAMLAALFLLGIFAGHVRNPDAVKREWAVVVSRILAGAGGFLLIRLLLFSYEERVPVLSFDIRSETAGAGGAGGVGSAIGELKERGYVTVSLSDIVEFVREQRYVPKKCFGLVIEAGRSEEVSRIADALPGSHLTILLPPGALDSDAARDRLSALPSEVSVGLSLAGKDGPKNADDLMSSLERSRERLIALNAGGPPFAKVGLVHGVDLRGVLKRAGYACFLDGRGFNRFGDEPHVLRLLDATPVVSAGRGGRELALYIGLFKGKHYIWPVAAMARLTGEKPGER